jgi:ABC-type nitrate/sulfonate/bicarbonate transport system permease component
MGAALISLGAVGVAMAFGIGPVGARLLRWRPEARGRP